MKIIYTIYISCVDGDTHYKMASPYTEDIQRFLAEKDHEGSCILLEVSRVYDNPEEAYKILET